MSKVVKIAKLMMAFATAILEAQAPINGLLNAWRDFRDDGKINGSTERAPEKVKEVTNEE